MAPRGFFWSRVASPLVARSGVVVQLLLGAAEVLLDLPLGDLGLRLDLLAFVIDCVGDAVAHAALELLGAALDFVLDAAVAQVFVLVHRVSLLRSVRRKGKPWTRAAHMAEHGIVLGSA